MEKYKKKLIEVALPLDDINAACSREKSIRHGHPSTLHLWWARRPLAAARAVIWASLVDDPSAHPEEFPTEDAQNKERERLFSILKELVIWENSNNEDVLNKAKAEILKSTNNDPPALLDPFMGGGAIPLEAQRLGLKAYGADLNPVAVIINKAMYEIPPKFYNQSPVNPDACNSINNQYPGTLGLAADVEYYGNMLKDMMFKKLGYLYPKVLSKDGYGRDKEFTVIAWLWARTVKCPNPACGCEMPLVSSFTIASKKKVTVIPHVNYETKKITYSVEYGSSEKKNVSKMGRGANFQCLYCGEAVESEYIRKKGVEKEIGQVLLAIVVEDKNGKIYLSPTEEQQKIATCSLPFDIAGPEGEIGHDLRDLRPPLYGYKTFSSLITQRQLYFFTSLEEMLPELKKIIERDALRKLNKDETGLNDKGNGATAYAESIIVYLSLLVDKLTDYNSSFCSWHSSKELIRNVFGRQCIPLVWDFAEANPFSNSSGSFSNMLAWIVEAIRNFPIGKSGEAVQWDATKDNGLRNIMVSTDPPYYDNIGYANLSDFFYVWMKEALKNIYPEYFKTILTPKHDELVASQYRFKGGAEEAKIFFENGMLETCKNLFKYTRDDIPVTIYYAFKQSDVDESGSASTGWETMLSAIINAGFSITGTWPMRTEMENRNIASGANALASSIVIVCRKGRELKPSTTLRDFIDELKLEMVPALKKLQASNIAPVDLAQSAIGPGIAVYSKYASVIQADGSALSVRDALKLINRELDSHLNEINSGIDTASSLCLTMYMQKGFNQWKYGEIETLATAKNISVESLDKLGVVKSGKGVVELKTREELPAISSGIDHPVSWLNTQQCVKAYEEKGDAGISNAFAQLKDNEISDVKSLCYQLYSIADKKGWTSEAYAYNSVISCWESAYAESQNIKKNATEPVQPELFDWED